MPARPIVSDAQWEIMLKYMQKHPNIARGSLASEGNTLKKITTEQWGILASQLNSVGTGTTKTVEKWREYWNNIKYAVRKKSFALLRNQQAKKTGRLFVKRLASLKEREEMILALVGKGTEDGEESVDETQTTAPIPLTPHKPSVSVSPLKPTVSPKTPLKPSDSSVPTMHQNPSGQVLPVLSNPTSSSIGSPKPKATSSTNTSDVIEQDRTRQVAVVDSNMSRMSLDDINSIQNQLQKSLWNHMIDPKTSTRPTFKYCLVLEPFGLIFICCNLDAVEWLTLTTENTPFAGHNLVVILDDLENKLPKTVDMYVNISTDLVHDNIESVFNVLVRTNQSWLNTRQWRLVPNKCVSVTSLSPSDVTCLCVVFSVPLNDILRLRREEFKLHFLFGVVPVDYYEETKKEVIEN
ncbi:uncharacterized protein [Choristoneura fumiferana]|uniref:uncharacterized protein n=1 Tax=Choristoneura fumiferana TaxID=7141 RepID=UPI003D15D2E8